MVSLSMEYIAKVFKRIDSIISTILITIIKIYQKLFSFDHSFWAKYVNQRVCIHEPSCSSYTVGAIEKYGSIKGLWLGTKRILRCGPWSRGGFDPVP